MYLVLLNYYTLNWFKWQVLDMYILSQVENN